MPEITFWWSSGTSKNLVKLRLTGSQVRAYTITSTGLLRHFHEGFLTSLAPAASCWKLMLTIKNNLWGQCKMRHFLATARKRQRFSPEPVGYHSTQNLNTALTRYVDL